MKIFIFITWGVYSKGAKNRNKDQCFADGVGNNSFKTHNQQNINLKLGITKNLGSDYTPLIFYPPEIPSDSTKKTTVNFIVW